ncbi:hypothetical protein F8388_002229 [Cannabis sativa]|uniref:Nicotianamine synthase n=1 Tax=Cannabis sativa TaxID=3483 RepID=A0A7J6FU94_CANSA|nr:hypothetical protein F8388_002229 [Cannabis sativa]
MSLQQKNHDEEDVIINNLITKICDLYSKISNLESLKPSKDVDTLFTELVHTCIPPCPKFDIDHLPKRVQNIRSNLIRLCGEAEGLLESHFSAILASFKNPLNNLKVFPYYNNYLKLGHLEYQILSQHLNNKQPKKIAFVGSGPLPLTSIVLASNHLTKTIFHNYDIDVSANSKASALMVNDDDLSTRMVFKSTDVMDVTSELSQYDVVFLAALVGLDKKDKVKVIEHLGKYMAPGSLLMLRSAHGARVFLYPVIDTDCDLQGFEVLSVFHPTDEIINSVVIARKHYSHNPKVLQMPSVNSSSSSLIAPFNCNCRMMIVHPNNCSHEIEAFNPLNIHGNMFEDKRS